MSQIEGSSKILQDNINLGNTFHENSIGYSKVVLLTQKKNKKNVDNLIEPFPKEEYVEEEGKQNQNASNFNEAKITNYDEAAFNIKEKPIGFLPLIINAVENPTMENINDAMDVFYGGDKLYKAKDLNNEYGILKDSIAIILKIDKAIISHKNVQENLINNQMVITNSKSSDSLIPIIDKENILNNNEKVISLKKMEPIKPFSHQVETYKSSKWSMSSLCGAWKLNFQLPFNVWYNNFWYPPIKTKSLSLEDKLNGFTAIDQQQIKRLLSNLKNRTAERIKDNGLKEIQKNKRENGVKVSNEKSSAITHIRMPSKLNFTAAIMENFFGLNILARHYSQWSNIIPSINEHLQKCSKKIQQNFKNIENEIVNENGYIEKISKLSQEIQDDPFAAKTIQKVQKEINEFIQKNVQDSNYIGEGKDKKGNVEHYFQVNDGSSGQKQIMVLGTTSIEYPPAFNFDDSRHVRMITTVFFLGENKDKNSRILISEPE